MEEFNTMTLIAEYQTECSYRGLSASTLGQHDWALTKLALRCPTLPCSQVDLMQVVGDQRLAPESRKDVLKCVRTFTKWVQRKYGLPNPCADLPKLPQRRTVPRVLTRSEVAQLVEAAESERDRVMVLLALDCGLRVGEIASLRRQHIGDGWVTVNGKVGQRRVPVSNDLLVRMQALGVGEHIWVGQRGPLTRAGVMQVYKRCFRRAGITGPKRGPHTIRHTSATFYLKSGGGVRQLQAILGHTDLDTTMRYVTLAGQDVQADHALHSPLRTLGLLDSPQ